MKRFYLKERKKKKKDKKIGYRVHIYILFEHFVNSWHLNSTNKRTKSKLRCKYARLLNNREYFNKPNSKMKN